MDFGFTYQGEGNSPKVGGEDTVGKYFCLLSCGHGHSQVKFRYMGLVGGCTLKRDGLLFRFVGHLVDTDTGEEFSVERKALCTV